MQLARSHDHGRTQRIEVVNISHPTPLQLDALTHANIVAVGNGTRLLAAPYGIWEGIDPVWIRPDQRRLKYPYTRTFVIER